METIADRVRKRCAELGIKPTKLEDGALIHRGYISKLLKADRTAFNLTPPMIAKLAAKLRTTERWLMHGIGSPDDPNPPAGPLPGSVPKLESRPGFREASLAVARKLRDVPLELIDQAGGLMFSSGGPDVVTEEYLTDLVEFLARHDSSQSRTDEVRERIRKKKK